jgi:CRISPR/Cas system CSM-associated protein Csm3 (group 7 of RAMP superfamily)
MESRRDHRKIVRRIIIRGNLVLETPTCLGNGERDSLTDLALLRDSISSHALLPGTSLAGALRNYLQERLAGYGQTQEHSLLTQLFGGGRGDDNGNQSTLIIHDSISVNAPNIEFRDGVKISSETGTAQDKAKYDLELVSAGTTFPLFFELLVEEGQDLSHLKQALATSLLGLETGEIAIGMKKRRGFGKCRVQAWQVQEFNLKNHKDCANWLNYAHWETGLLPEVDQHAHIVTALGNPKLEDKRHLFKLSATFEIQGGLLIRSGQATVGIAPDVVQLTAQQVNGQRLPVLPGTSWAGVMRHRAERILDTLGVDKSMMNQMFGDVPEGKPDPKNLATQAKASRLVVHESVITESHSMVQNRIAIDRFTGGALHGALFDEQPVFGGHVTLNLELRHPQDSEIGLLLLLLKDLWTGDLPVGGTSSIGRGRLKGLSAQLKRGNEEWSIEQGDGRLVISDTERLERFVAALVIVTQGEKAA